MTGQQFRLMFALPDLTTRDTGTRRQGTFRRLDISTATQQQGRFRSQLLQPSPGLHDSSTTGNIQVATPAAVSQPTVLPRTLSLVGIALGTNIRRPARRKPTTIIADRMSTAQIQSCMDHVGDPSAYPTAIGQFTTRCEPKPQPTFHPPSAGAISQKQWRRTSFDEPPQQPTRGHDR